MTNRCPPKYRQVWLRNSQLMNKHGFPLGTSPTGHQVQAWPQRFSPTWIHALLQVPFTLGGADLYCPWDIVEGKMCSFHLAHSWITYSGGSSSSLRRGPCGEQLRPFTNSQSQLTAEVSESPSKWVLSLSQAPRWQMPSWLQPSRGPTPEPLS